MKIFNRINTLVVAAVAAFSLTGCEEFLTEHPKTLYTFDTAFEKSSQVDAAVSNAYRAFSNLYSWKYYALGTTNATPYSQWSSALLNGMGTDVVDHWGRSASGSANISYYAALNTATTEFYYLWRDLYKLAAQANLTMKGAELVDWANDSDKQYAIAQVKFFRGWAYLRLAECFGGVPVVEEFSEEFRTDYTRAPREEVYSFAIKDMEKALSVLPDYPKQDGRISKGIVNHFLAEAYIARGTQTNNSADYQKAVDYAKKTISLHPMMYERFGVRANAADKGVGHNNVPNYKEDGNVYYDLFQIGNYRKSQGNTESLMQLLGASYDQCMSYGIAYPARYFLYPQPNCGGEAIRDIVWNTAKAKEHADLGAKESSYPLLNNGLAGGSMSHWLGGGTWAVYVSTDYSDEIVWEGNFAKDIRNEQVNRWDPTVLNLDSPYYGQKLDKNDIDDPSMLMRLSHKMTMMDGWGWTDQHADYYREDYTCQYGRDWHVARSSETWLLLAEAYLRMGNNAEATAAVNEVRKRAQADYMYGSVTMYDILDERARELSWEEHRWPTYLRMTDGSGKNEYMDTNLAKYTMYGNDMGNHNGAPKWHLFPIPFTAINQNSGAELTQNPGW